MDRPLSLVHVYFSDSFQYEYVALLGRRSYNSYDDDRSSCPFVLV